MTVTVSASAPIPGDNHRNLADEPTVPNLPVQRGPLGNRDQVDDRRGPRQFVPANTPCPLWCADCWQGSNHGDDPDPGTSFHHGAPLVVRNTSVGGTAIVGVELERLDFEAQRGDTRIWVRVVGGEENESLTVDEAKQLRDHLTALIDQADA